MVGGAVLVAHEIALPFKLHHLGRIGFGHTRLDPRVLQNFQRLRIKVRGEVAGIRVWLGEQRVVEADFGGFRGGGEGPTCGAS